MAQSAERKVGVGEESIDYYNTLGCVHAEVTYILVQKLIDTKLKDFFQANAIIDVILAVSKGRKTEHTAKVHEVPKKLDVANAALKLRKFEFFRSECE